VSSTTARYDGQTEWYDAYTSADVFSIIRDFAVHLLGPGPGRCLDLGCGTGRAIPALAAAGWSVVGTDVSVDQLEAARSHAPGATLIQADAHALPFEDCEFDAVVSMLTHTDFDDPQVAFAEACRVLRGGGVFVYLGVHPCFGSPFVKRMEDETIVLQPGYRDAGWQRHAPGVSSTGVRAHVASTIFRSPASSTRSSAAASRSSKSKSPAPPTHRSSWR
jgi:ubiquinone/menaquinone biosynthesis C-methylase UbiE